MPDEHIINPWLTEQIRLYKAAHADAELREAYYRLRETDPDRTWFGFLIDSSVQAAIRENPFLGRKFIDTDLPGHTVDILLAHEIDSVAFLMQVSLQELSSLAGVTEADVRAVVDFLREGGLRLEEKGFTRKQSFSWDDLERQPAESIRKQAEEKIHALGESCDLELDEWYRITAETHRETVLLLRTIGADKETLRKALYEQARFLRDQIPEHPEYTEEALDAAWEDQELSEYLFGTYSKENALAWELQADILFMGGRYAEALEKYSPPQCGHLPDRAGPAGRGTAPALGSILLLREARRRVPRAPVLDEPHHRAGLRHARRLPEKAGIHGPGRKIRR